MEDEKRTEFLNGVGYDGGNSRSSHRLRRKLHSQLHLVLSPFNPESLDSRSTLTSCPFYVISFVVTEVEDETQMKILSTGIETSSTIL